MRNCHSAPCSWARSAPPRAGRGGAGSGAASGDQVVNVPFAFYSEFFGAAAGFVTYRSGYPQPQARVLGTIMVGSKGSVMGFFMGRDIRMPGTERLFLDPWVSMGYFVDDRAYVDGNPAYPERTRRAATIPIRTTTSKATVRTSSRNFGSSTCFPSGTARTRPSARTGWSTACRSPEPPAGIPGIP